MVFDLKIFWFATIPYNFLVAVTFVGGIFFPIGLMVDIGPGIVVDHHLVAPIEIIIAVLGRQGSGKYPTPPLLVDILMSRNRIVHINIGYIVIIGIIITDRSPYRLTADVDVDTYLRFGILK
jgi:hypothetical protein